MNQQPSTTNYFTELTSAPTERTDPLLVLQTGVMKAYLDDQFVALTAGTISAADYQRKFFIYVAILSRYDDYVAEVNARFASGSTILTEKQLGWYNTELEIQLERGGAHNYQPKQVPMPEVILEFGEPQYSYYSTQVNPQLVALLQLTFYQPPPPIVQPTQVIIEVNPIENLSYNKMDQDNQNPSGENIVLKPVNQFNQVIQNQISDENINDNQENNLNDFEQIIKQVIEPNKFVSNWGPSPQYIPNYKDVPYYKNPDDDADENSPYQDNANIQTIRNDNEQAEVNFDNIANTGNRSSLVDDNNEQKQVSDQEGEQVINDEIIQKTHLLNKEDFNKEDSKDDVMSKAPTATSVTDFKQHVIHLQKGGDGAAPTYSHCQQPAQRLAIDQDVALSAHHQHQSQKEALYKASIEDQVSDSQPLKHESGQSQMITRLKQQIEIKKKHAPPAQQQLIAQSTPYKRQNVSSPPTPTPQQILSMNHFNTWQAAFDQAQKLSSPKTIYEINRARVEDAISKYCAVLQINRQGLTDSQLAQLFPNLMKYSCAETRGLPESQRYAERVITPVSFHFEKAEGLMRIDKLFIWVKDSAQTKEATKLSFKGMISSDELAPIHKQILDSFVMRYTPFHSYKCHFPTAADKSILVLVPKSGCKGGVKHVSIPDVTFSEVASLYDCEIKKSNDPIKDNRDWIRKRNEDIQNCDYHRACTNAHNLVLEALTRLGPVMGTPSIANTSVSRSTSSDETPVKQNSDHDKDGNQIEEDGSGEDDNK